MANYADAARTPRTLTEREQRALLKVTGEHRAGYRDHCLYAMALGTGLREHELIALSVGDVFRDGRSRRRLLLSVFKGVLSGKSADADSARIPSSDAADGRFAISEFGRAGGLVAGIEVANQSVAKQ
ncbi:MAG: hypothetical protein KAI24_03220 [Planctomycetes bacterium]|nr:hypothetical protein [Planctomycetota bacterium]